MKNITMLFLMPIFLLAAGCAMTPKTPSGVAAYGTPLTEPEWIRNGEPFEFEGDVWYPTDEVERLLDSEVYALGTYRDTLFFIDRTDVKPYDRLYTNFGKNRYRAFEKKL